ncbi:DUF2235 domain-containing protein [Sphingomonas sp.]|jgi:hypothetical protein|uniref:T6SS phospholipase effector Tle1-like catalytic domain-containing protein n=1 Tax=Sphingomonas sp. TaxID=28214 RepID=UPI002D801732|nr:DUF2235 domain-containing protein [Sphingomonas sp.]HEU0044501.1 DUF2235 domain-containing protein [Sphingomonas sp.]
MARAATPTRSPQTPPARPQSVACQTCPDNKKPRRVVTVRASIFFDGTQNNRTNTDLRLAYDRQRASGGRARSPGSGSYENDYSNVAILEQVIAKEQPGYDYFVPLYVEGIGTTDRDSDTTMPGVARGTGATGIEAKVKSGLDRMVREIASKVGDPSNTRIAHVHIDSFGFSRGAAAARHFIQRAVRDGAERVMPRLQASGFEVGQVKMRYVGLFDTVASHGGDRSDDTRTLSLNAIAVAEKVVQLAAAEEHREYFPLTNIDSAGNGTQIFLPGVHSDVGGGYVDNGAETNYQVFDLDTVRLNQAERAALQRERDWLIALGWYLPAEIGDTSFFNEINVNRTGIRNTFARIPLQMQARLARELQLVWLPTLQQRHAVPADLRGVEASVTRINAQSPGVYFNSRDAVHRRLRHRYLHFSARYGEIGHWPNWVGGKINGRRQRVIFNG